MMIEGLKRIIKEYGLDVIIVGRNVDVQTDEIMGLLEIDGVTIFQEGKCVRSRSERKNNACGPRNRWGALK